ncbi:MAG TPA: hypothetical protein ENI73_06395 [Spirochaetes bacterium]|nr:hypothetical protein [Spirochaetota bacterium]
MNKKIIGIAIFVAIIAAALIYQFTGSGSSPKEILLNGLIGGEKKGFLEDEDVKSILKEKYGVVIDYSKAGSIEMVKGNTQGRDFLWPSSQVALEIFKTTKAKHLVKSGLIFNSPIVLYSWSIVTDALIKAGIVKKVAASYFVVDFPKLINLVMEGKKWSDIGLTDLYGKISIISTDPNKSNSGNMFAGLLANILYGDVVDESSVEKYLPKLKTFFSHLGYMESSSGNLFEQYLTTGVGAKPIIVGYESQAIEFSIQNEELWPKVKDRIRILYPVPTVWSAHPLIVLNPKANILIKALQDKEIQKIAWEKHGFRTGLIGVDNDPKLLKVVGIPERIKKVIPMPKAQVMEKIMQALQN